MLILFVENGQDVNAVGFGGQQSILIRSVMHHHTDAVKYLLDKTAIDLNFQVTNDVSLCFGGVKAYEGETAIDIAARKQMHDIVEMLEKVTTEQNRVSKFLNVPSLTLIFQTVRFLNNLIFV